MTALNRYQKLEGSGLWRADGQAQRRDVAVRLGDSTLTLADARSGSVLAHWALTAVQRANPGRRPAEYRPGADDQGESLETDDPILIEAIEAVHAALNPPPPGRYLRWGVLAAGAAVIAVGLWWLPNTLYQRTAATLPQAMQAQVGREALDALVRPGSTVRVCAEPAGRQVLTALRNRVLGDTWRVVVLDGLDGFEAGHLPGRVIVLSRGLVERLDSAEALAGWLIAQELAHDARDPMLDVLRYAGIRATLSMLTTGALPERALDGYSAARLTRPVVWPDAGGLGTRLEALGVPFAPFAESLPPQAARLAAIMATGPDEGVPILTDGEWLTLQSVCVS